MKVCFGLTSCEFVALSRVLFNISSQYTFMGSLVTTLSFVTEFFSILEILILEVPIPPSAF